MSRNLIRLASGRLRDQPIRRKLLFVVMATTVMALAVSGLGLLWADSQLFNRSLKRDLSALGRIIAANSTAALVFHDPEAASQILSTLRIRVHVAGACLIEPSGAVLGSYSRDGVFHCPAVQGGSEIATIAGGLRVFEPVILKGTRVGTLVFDYDAGEVAERHILFGSTMASILIAGGLVAFVLASQLRELILVPIERLVSAATAVSKTGDYGIRVDKTTGDEMGFLVDRFNEMLGGIEEREKALKLVLAGRETALREAERERERFRFMAESMPQKIFTTRPDGFIDYCNKQWFDFTGYSLEQMNQGGWTEFVHPDDAAENMRVWQRCIATGEPYLFEHRIRRFDGVYRWHLSRANPMRDASGRVTMWIGSNTDIHEQKEKEEALRRANHDLEQFAYSASHDLQEPIRNVSVYSDLIALRYAKVLDDDGRLFLKFLREGGLRLSTLVSDLLAYTRASMAEIDPSSARAEEALSASLKDLEQSIQATGAEITVDPLPEVGMAKSHLEQIFQNLLGNAIKYRGPERPQIHISACETGDWWCISVRDNGIGIEPQYQERIFGVFKRLHHDANYSGNGIGLAICQRIVNRYGGRIWVKSQPGNGSTFFFTVPATGKRGQPILERAAS